MFYLKEKDVSLREFCEGDIENKVKWINDEKNNRYLHYDIPLTVEKTRTWFKNKQKNRLDCVIEYDKIPVGLTGLIGIDELSQKAEFYISMGRDDFKRKGVATVATKLILRYAFGELSLSKVYLNVDEENVAACRMYEKIGFRLEGNFKEDMYHRGKPINRCRYAAFAEDFRGEPGEMNILILSAGTRNKVVQYFKKALCGKGRVVASDCSSIAPSLYDADKFYIVSKITADGYIDTVLDICRKENIKGVLSLIDPELSLLAKNVEEFLKIGTAVIGSGFDACERTLNKYEMYRWLTENGYKCAKSYVDKDEFFKAVEEGCINYPVFVKPTCGSASIAVSKVYDRETLDILLKNNDGLMIQEFLNGQEIGADCYIDMISGEVVSIFTKKKLAMRAGETDKAVSFKDQRLFALIEKFCKDFGFKGQIDIDIFDVCGEYYISEVNPRFGGGYPHAYESGVDHMTLIANNLEGKANAKNIGNYDDGIYMMKYSEVKILKEKLQ